MIIKIEKCVASVGALFMRRRRLLAGIAATATLGALGVGPSVSLAAEYPDKPIRLVVPVPTGGVTDVVGRMLANELSNVLGQTVMVENKGGASGTIGTAQVARAPADGYTLLLAMDTHSSNQFLFDNLDYDAVRDFSPVALLGTVPMVLLGGPSLPKTTFPAVIEHLKQNPEGYAYGSIGLGSQTHLPASLLESSADVKMLHVPYTGGGPMANALLGGHVHFIFASLMTAVKLAQREEVQVFAICGPERAAAFPDVPTTAELGHPSVKMGMWFGVFAPAGTPGDVISKLSSAIGNILTDEKVNKRLVDMQMTVDYRDPDGFRQFFEEDIVQRGELIKRENIGSNNPK